MLLERWIAESQMLISIDKKLHKMFICPFPSLQVENKGHFSHKVWAAIKNRQIDGRNNSTVNLYSIW